ncbi:hypothetical protein ABVT39_001760 [Epinephelus coioides]
MTAFTAVYQCKTCNCDVTFSKLQFSFYPIKQVSRSSLLVEPFCRIQQDIFPPYIFPIAAITRSTESQRKVSHLQAERHLHPLLLSPLLASCTEPHHLLLLKMQLHMKLHELVASSQHNHFTGFKFWALNSRKVYAISDFVEFQNGRRAKASRRSQAEEVVGNIDHLKNAAESLSDITSAINQLSELAKAKSAAASASLHPIKDAFTCMVCRGTPEETRRLIKFRAENEQRFLKSKAAAKQLWETLIKELGLEGKITSSKKWENLKKKYKELRTPKAGSGTDAGETTASSWQFFEDMLEVLGARPSMDPPVLVASYDDPFTLLMEIIKPTPSTSATASSEAATSDAPTTAAATVDMPPTPSPKKKKRKLNHIVDFLAQESEKEQKRHEESEKKTERFLSQFEILIDKI